MAQTTPGAGTPRRSAALHPGMLSALLTGPAAPAPTRSRRAVSVLFLLLGLQVGGWLSRVPDVKAGLALDDAAWGATIVWSTAGSLLALGATAHLLGRTGPRRLVRAAVPLLVVVVPLLALAPSRAALAVLLVVFGVATSGLNAPMNAQAVAVERAYGRPVMSAFHACFSLGTLAGALLGSAASSAGLAPAAQLAATSAALAVAAAVTTRDLPADPARAVRRPGGRPRVTRPLVVLSVVALCAALVEGTASMWSAIYVTEALGAPAALGALAYACFAGAMTLGRLLGDRVVQALGRPRFLRLAGALAAAGLGLGLLSGSPAGACAGFALLGAGVACVVPTVYGLAGDQPGTSTAAGVTTVTLASWPAFLVGPPLVGQLSALAGLRSALLLVVAAAVVVAVLGGRVASQRPVTNA